MGGRGRRGFGERRSGVSVTGLVGRGIYISSLQNVLASSVFSFWLVLFGGITEVHAGPETRTTAIAALPGAVDNAYIVESASSINGKRRVEEKLRIGL